MMMFNLTGMKNLAKTGLKLTNSFQKRVVIFKGGEKINQNSK